MESGAHFVQLIYTATDALTHPPQVQGEGWSTPYIVKSLPGPLERG